MAPQEVYVIPDTADTADESVWIRPQSIADLVVDAVLEATDYEPEDIEPLETYVDHADLRALLDADESAPLSFQLEACEVTVHSSGDVDVAQID